MQIVLIPGIGGSKIYCCCNEKRVKLYPKKFYKIPLNISSEFFNKDCNSSTAPLYSWYGISIYKNFITKFPNTVFHHYDWRRPCIELARDLMQALDKLKDPFCIVAHSNGGLLIRCVVEYYKYDNPFMNKIFICGTPLYGSVNINNYKYERYLTKDLNSSSPSVKYKPMMLTRGDFKRIIQTYRQTLEYLCPTPHVLKNSDFSYPKILHLCFSRRNFQRYIFIYNVHKTTRVEDDTPFSMLNGKYFNIKSDSLVIPMMDFTSNTVVFFDHNNFPHFGMLNSSDLQSFIMNSYLGKKLENKCIESVHLGVETSP